jgi:chemotaxis receptor (MCP) glutamine deamidase CheD
MPVKKSSKMKVKGKRTLKNGAVAGYVYYSKEKKWKWRIIGRDKKGGGRGKGNKKYTCSSHKTNKLEEMCVVNSKGKYNTLEECVFSNECLEKQRSMPNHRNLPTGKITDLITQHDLYSEITNKNFNKFLEDISNLYDLSEGNNNIIILTNKSDGTKLYLKKYPVYNGLNINSSKVQLNIYTGRNQGALDSFLDIDSKILSLIVTDYREINKIKSNTLLINEIPNINYNNYNNISNDKIINVRQKEFALTCSNDKRYILQTYGLGPCVAICGYNNSRKIGFLTHVDATTNLDNMFSILLQKVQELNVNFDIYLIGGETNKVFIINLIKYLQKIKYFNIKSKDILKQKSQSISINTKNGNISEYAKPLTEKNNQVHLMIIQMDNNIIIKYISDKC